MRRPREVVHLQEVRCYDDAAKDTLIIAKAVERVSASSMAEVVYSQGHIGATRDSDPEGKPPSSEAEERLSVYLRT